MALDVNVLWIVLLWGRVILIGRNEQRLQETMLQMANDNHVLLSLDLTNIELMAQKGEKEVVKKVSIAGVINCAGVSSVTPLKLIKETDDSYDSIPIFIQLCF